jgi:putative MATE family efflux protein
MYAMMAGALLNIVLDPIFIYTLKLGVAGAAWATLISIGLSSSIIFYWIFIKRDTYVTIRLKEFRFNKKIVFDILRVGLPVSIQQLAMSLSVLILNLIVVRAGGSDGVAIFTTGWRVATFASLPLIGMATAVTSVAGAAYGGRDYPRLDIAYMYALKIGIAIEFGVSFLTFILAPQITKLFTYSPDAARLAQALMGFLRTMCLYYPTASLGILSSGLFQGTGKGIFSLIVTIFRTIVLAVPLAYLFALGLDFGLPGVWWGIVSGNIMGGIVAFIWARIYIRNLKG